MKMVTMLILFFVLEQIIALQIDEEMCIKDNAAMDITQLHSHLVDNSNDASISTNLPPMKGLNTFVTSVKGNKKVKAVLKDQQQMKLNIEKEPNATLMTLSALIEATNNLHANMAIGEEPRVLKTEEFTVKLFRSGAHFLGGVDLGLVRFPPNIPVEKFTGNLTETIDTQVFEFPNSPNWWVDSKLSSSVVQVDLKINDSVIPVHDLADPIALYLPVDPDSIKQALESGIEAKISRDSRSATILLPTSLDSTAYLLLIQFTEGDDRKANIIQTDGEKVLKQKTLLTEPNTDDVASLFLSDIHSDEYTVTVETTKDINFKVSLTSLSCLYYDEYKELWQNTGCTPGSQSNTNTVECLCTHLSSFGAKLFPLGIQLAANSTDPTTEKPSEDRSCLYGILTMAIMMLIYPLALAVCYTVDGKDALLREEAKLCESDPTCVHGYLVAIQLSSFSDEPESISVVLEGSHYVSEDMVFHVVGHHMLMGMIHTPLSIGRLKAVHLTAEMEAFIDYCTIRHVVVMEKESNISCHIVCNLKLRNQKVILDTNTPLSTAKLFALNLSSMFRDLHTWVSIFTCPLFTNIERIYRVTVLFFTLFMMTLLATATAGNVRPEWGILIATVLLPVHEIIQFVIRACNRKAHIMSKLSSIPVPSRYYCHPGNVRSHNSTVYYVNESQLQETVADVEEEQYNPDTQEDNEKVKARRESLSRYVEVDPVDSAHTRSQTKQKRSDSISHGVTLSDSKENYAEANDEEYEMETYTSASSMFVIALDGGLLDDDKLPIDDTAQSTGYLTLLWLASCKQVCIYVVWVIMGVFLVISIIVTCICTTGLTLMESNYWLAEFFVAVGIDALVLQPLVIIIIAWCISTAHRSMIDDITHRMKFDLMR